MTRKKQQRTESRETERTKDRTAGSQKQTTKERDTEHTNSIHHKTEQRSEDRQNGINET